MAFHVVFRVRRCVEKTLLGVFLLFAGSLALGNVPLVPDWTKEIVLCGKVGHQWVHKQPPGGKLLNSFQILHRMSLRKNSITKLD